MHRGYVIDSPTRRSSFRLRESRSPFLLRDPVDLPGSGMPAAGSLACGGQSAFRAVLTSTADGSSDWSP
jgi:hypothetical protein